MLLYLGLSNTQTGKESHDLANISSFDYQSWVQWENLILEG
jgi:hypothetical protein